MATAADFNHADAVEVVIGPPLGGIVPLWDGTTTTLWTADHHGVLAMSWGGQTIVAETAGAGCFQERGWLDRANNVLFVPNVESHGEFGGSTGWGEFFSLTPTTPPAARPAWRELQPELAGLFDAAHNRGEMVMLTAFGSERPDQKILWGPFTCDARAMSVICASPTPTTRSGWPGEGDRTNRTTIFSSRDPDGLDYVAAMAVAAMQEWGVAPWEICPTFVSPILLAIAAGDPVVDESRLGTPYEFPELDEVDVRPS